MSEKTKTEAVAEKTKSITVSKKQQPTKEKSIPKATATSKTVKAVAPSKVTTKASTEKKSLPAKASPTKKPSSELEPSKAKKGFTKKGTVIKARITSYRRCKGIIMTNQAIAEVLDDYNHKALVGKRFYVQFPESNKILKGYVAAIHGQGKNKQLRLHFSNSGMTAHALSLIAEIYL